MFDEQILSEIKKGVISACVDGLRFFIQDSVKKEISTALRTEVNKYVAQFLAEIKDQKCVSVDNQHFSLREYVQFLLNKPCNSRYNHHDCPRIQAQIESIVSQEAREVISQATREQLKSVKELFETKLIEAIKSLIN